MSTLLDCVETVTGNAPVDASVVFLHGLGADGHDFAPVVRDLGFSGGGLRFVFPHAPVRRVTINGGAAMRAWYDIAHLDLANRADEAGLAESMAQADALIAREVERGVPPSRIVLGGFSQGGAVALALAMRRPQPLAGVIALSTYLPAPDAARAARPTAAQGMPVFMAHGQMDPVVPYAAGELSAQVLRAAGFDVEWHAYPMPHSVSPQEIADLARWLRLRLRGTQD